MNRPGAQLKAQLFEISETGLVDLADEMRLRISPTLNAERRANLGQFMTPGIIADFMASQFDKSKYRSMALWMENAMQSLSNYLRLAKLVLFL